MPSSTTLYAPAIVIFAGIWSSLAIAQTPAAGSGDPAAFTLQKYVGGSFAVSYPAGWATYGSDDNVIFAPPGGLSRASNGGTVINLGILMRYEKNAELRKLSLERYTEQFLKQCCQSYPGYRMEHQEVFRGQTFPAMDTVVSSIAADGNREVNRLMTMRLPDGFFTMVLAVPASQAKAYFYLFGRIIGTLEPGKNLQRQSVAEPPSPGLSGVGGNCESFQSDSVSFCYPRGWSVRRTQATPHEVFVVTPNDASRQSVMIRHLHRPGEVLYLKRIKMICGASIRTINTGSPRLARLTIRAVR